jgi:hypothetical protein
MSDEILQCIIDCAHEYKIESQEDLAKETQWTGVHDHAANVIKLIKAHHPKPLAAPLLTSMPLCLQLGNVNEISNPNSRTVKLRKCSKCGSQDHICALII